jgi:23S rRNA (adenine2503-C2)-methyltransferase
MGYRDRVTICISSQAGCGMNCPFCATGQAGLTRNLSTAEIVGQVVAGSRMVRFGDFPGGRERVSNVVFMGMGEPLANREPLWGAIERIHGDIGISARHITVSTVGIVPGITWLARQPLPVNLAVSLHAANDRLRDELVPINRRHDIASLMAACRDYLSVRNRRITFEWALIDGTNDSRRDADELADLCLGLAPAAHVNIIPLNPTPGWPTMGSPAARVAAFRSWLTARGVNATVRRNRGTEIDAACGQLAAGQPVAPPARARSHDA